MRSQWKGWEDSTGGKGQAEADRKQQSMLRGCNRQAEAGAWKEDACEQKQGIINLWS